MQSPEIPVVCRSFLEALGLLSRILPFLQVQEGTSCRIVSTHGVLIATIVSGGQCVLTELGNDLIPLIPWLSENMWFLLRDLVHFPTKAEQVKLIDNRMIPIGLALIEFDASFKKQVLKNILPDGHINLSANLGPSSLPNMCSDIFVNSILPALAE
jgi:hypothetical protein